MRKFTVCGYFLLLCTLICSIRTNAQLNDVQWMLGPKTSSIDFRGVSPVNDSIEKWMMTRFTNAAISDDSGELLYYTNGIYIAGKQDNGDSILNGNDLNPCAYTNVNSSGLPLLQAAIFLIKPGSNSYYYLIHFSGDINNGVPYTLMYSIIDKDANGGLGAVISKNDTIYQTIFRRGGLSACKHANGRDWWIVLASRNSNNYNTFLLTPNGIKDTLSQNIGPNYMGPLDNSYSRFSLDGSKYITGAYGGVITVMDFDRCTGQFSNPLSISNINPPGTVSASSSVELSPNGRFLYIPDRLGLNQYDLFSTNPQDSCVKIFECGCPDGAQLNMFSLAYNGKIYGSTWAGGFYFLHVINNPNEKGLGCNFAYGGQPTLSINSINVSNTANPRLGPLLGSGCDTITTGIRQTTINENQQARVLPNPADKAFYIEMPLQGNYRFELLNDNGQVVAQRETHQVDIINVETLSNGVYYLHVYEKIKKLSISKLIVQH